MSNLREPLLHAGFRSYEGQNAGGIYANNKLEIGYDDLSGVPELREEVVRELGTLAALYEPDLIVPVPNGANGYGADVAKMLDIQSLILGKNPVTRDIYYDTGGLSLIKNSRRIVIVEDVLNGLTTTNRILGMACMAERTRAVVGIWDRGDPAARAPLPAGIALDSIISEHIPAKLPPKDERWKYAS